MKKVLTALLLIAAIIGCKAQQPRTESQPVNFLKWLHVKDTMRVKIIFQGINDTLATQAYARGFAGGSLTAGVGIKVTGSTISIDTLHYRKQDSMYVLTDSTGIFKINGLLYPFKLRGGVWAFNHRLGDVLPAKNDYAAFYPKLDSSYEDPGFISHLSWAKMISTPQTLQGYTILDGVQNAGGIGVLQADAFSNRPAPGGGGSIFLATDSSVLYYNNGSTWQPISNPNGGTGGSDTVVVGSYGILTTVAGKNKIFKIDTTTLKQVFGSGSPGVVQLFTKYGLVINGTDTASVDTTLFMRYQDTLSLIASRTYVNTRGFIITESDPVAIAKQISITGTPNAGINVTGAAQAIGSNPSFTLKADTSLLSTHTYTNSRGFISAEVDPVASIDTINLSAVASAGIIVGGTQKQTLGASPTWTFKVDSAIYATRYALTHQGYISSEVDPVANAKTVNLSATPNGGAIVTGLGSQTLTTNPTWTVKVDTAIIATRNFLTGAYIPSDTLRRNYNIYAPGKLLALQEGAYSASSPTNHSTSNLFSNSLSLLDSASGTTGFFLKKAGGVKGTLIGEYNNITGPTGKIGAQFTQDTIQLFPDTATRFTFARNGTAAFPGIITAAVAPSTADSSTRVPNTGWVARNAMPQNYHSNNFGIMQGFFQHLQLGAGNSGGFIFDAPTARQSVMIGGTAGIQRPAVTFIDSSDGHGGELFIFNGVGIMMQGAVSLPAGHGLWMRPDTLALWADGATPTYFKSDGNAIFKNHITGITEATNDSSNFLASTAWVRRQSFGAGGGGTDSSLFAGLWLAKSTVGKANTLRVDTAAAAAYLLRKKDSVGVTGFATNYQLTTGLANTLSTAGTVKSVATGLFLSGGPITNTGTLLADSAAMAGYFPRRKDSTLTFVTPTQLRAVSAIRVSPIDSLSRSSNGIQVAGQTIIPQTANGTNPGLEPIPHWLEVDSLIRRLLKSSVTIGHPGAGKWSGYSSPLGDTLYLRNNNVTTGLTQVAQADSSMLFGADFTTVAGVTNTQTLTNKTLTSPVINSGTLATPTITGLSGSGDSTTYKPIGLDGSGNPRRMTFWPGSGAGGGSQNLSQSLSAVADTLKISGGSGTTILGATHSAAGLVTAAMQTRLDSTIIVANAKGKPILRAPYTMDSLIARGLGMTASLGIKTLYTGNNDSLSWDVRDDTTGAREGYVKTFHNNLPQWMAISGTGSVTGFTSTPTVGTLFSTAVANPNTAVAQTITLQNAGANTLWGSVAGGVPAYFNPSLTSSLFANEGTAVTVLHGNAAGNPSFSPFNYATDGTGTIQAANFPALTGVIQNTAGTLSTSFVNGSVNTAALATAAVDLTTKVTGILPGANGGTGVNNSGKTITVGGNFTTSGANPVTLTTTGTTNVTLPTSGTLLATNGNGSGLSGVVTGVTGTSNQVITNAATGGITLSLPQSIAPTNSPTFTGATLTGLATGASSDNLVTEAGGVLRSTPASVFGIASGTYVPTIQGTLNWTNTGVVSGVYSRCGNVVTVTVRCAGTVSTTGAAAFIIQLPIPSNFTDVTHLLGQGTCTGGAIGYIPSYGFAAGTGNSTAQVQFSAPATGGVVISHFTFQYLVE